MEFFSVTNNKKQSSKMKRFLFFSFCLFPLLLVAQKHTISGYIYQHNTGETLLSAYIEDSVNHKKTISNNSGFYSLTLPKGNVNITASYMGNKSINKKLVLSGDTSINFYLPQHSKEIGEVVIHGEIPMHEQTLMGKTLVPIETIIKTPSFVGVPDLMKALTAIPGFSGGGEGRSDLFVRGGDRGQNLILLDGAKLYNTNHLGGFISLFNIDIIKHVEAYKSGFPARYGGRASSIIDITTRDGNRKNINGKITLGLLNSSLSVNGPLNKKLTFNAGIRTTYYNLITIPLRKQYKEVRNSGYTAYNFYDANIKFTYHASDKHKLLTSFYSGDDRNRWKEKTNTSNHEEESEGYYNIYNTSFSIGNRLRLSPKTMWKNYLVFSRYKNILTSNEFSTYEGVRTDSEYETSTSINEINLQSHLEHYRGKYVNLKIGTEFSHYQFIPGTLYSLESNNATGMLSDTIMGYTELIGANELAFYAENEMAIGAKTNINTGVRGVLFNSKGTTYIRAEPRVSVRTKLRDNLSAKASYTLMNQFAQVIIQNYFLFEKEVWLTSTSEIPPQQAHQFSAGIFGSIPRLHIELSGELYYKTLNNLLEYKSVEADDIPITSLDEMVLKNGYGVAYGAEFQAKFNSKNISLDAGYVISWNNRRFDELNDGKWYPFIYDRRHNFTLLGSFILGKHYSLNTNFTFSTGRPYTMPESYVSTNYSMEGYDYYVLSGYNNFRMPNYHRLDISFVKRNLTKRKKRPQQFTLNIFNVYARNNPTKIYFRNGKLYQASFFSIIPTISYTLEF